MAETSWRHILADGDKIQVDGPCTILVERDSNKAQWVLWLEMDERVKKTLERLREIEGRGKKG